MKNAKKIIISFVLLAFLTSGFGMINIYEAKAGNLWDMQKKMMTGTGKIGEKFGDTNPNDPTDPREIVVKVIKVFLTFLSLIFIIMIIWAGFNWMTSQGNDDTIKQAKSQLKAAIIGMIIILAAYVITNWVAYCVMDIATGIDIWYCL